MVILFYWNLYSRLYRSGLSPVSIYSVEEFFGQLKHYIKNESPDEYDEIVRVIDDTIKNKITRPIYKTT